MKRAFLVLICAAAGLRAADYAIGADLSFLKQNEDRGVVFKDNGEAKPGLQIFKDHGYNWIRLRLFHTPTQLPNSLEYTIALAKAARQLGYRFLLDYHYSDTWADPGKQFIPKAWEGMSHEQMVQALLDYTKQTTIAFREAGVLPDMVQIGNEITNGILWPDAKLPANWDHFADFIKAGIAGVEAGTGDGVRPRIMIHIDKGGDAAKTKWFFDKLNSYRRELRRHRAILLSLVARQPERPSREPHLHGQRVSQGHHGRGGRLQLAAARIHEEARTLPRISRRPEGVSRRSEPRRASHAVWARQGRLLVGTRRFRRAWRPRIFRCRRQCPASHDRI